MSKKEYTLVFFGSLFQIDAVMPTQFLAVFSGSRPACPERKLILAVLEEAFHCYQKYVLAKDARRKRLFREAEEWINSSDRSWPFSFVNICETLGINPEYLRRGMQAWKQQVLSLPPAIQSAAPAPPSTKSDDLK